MFRFVCAAGILCVSYLAAAEISEKFAKRLESTEAIYHSAVQKADNTRFYAIQKANGDRVKALKSAMADATKAGDFDAATAIKARLAIAESAGVARPKPKSTAKLNGHEYALIETEATWNSAQRICEEMGGHLATYDTPQEEALLRQLVTPKTGTWIGASDAMTEGEWKWVTGEIVAPEVRKTWLIANRDGLEHSLAFWPPTGSWEDGIDALRYYFICEWEK